MLQVSLVGFIIGLVVIVLVGYFGDFYMLIVGCMIQGVVSGVLLLIMLVLGVDLWLQCNCVGVFGGIGVVQEFGSVLGLLYGIFIVWLLYDWCDVFWINVLLIVIVMVMIYFSLFLYDCSMEFE